MWYSRWDSDPHFIGSKPIPSTDWGTRAYKNQLIESFYFHYWTGNSTEPTQQGSPFPPAFLSWNGMQNTPSFSLHRGMVLTSPSVLLPTLAIALTRLYCGGIHFITGGIRTIIIALLRLSNPSLFFARLPGLPMVRNVGLEPTRPNEHSDLNAACLPIPAVPHKKDKDITFILVLIYNMVYKITGSCQPSSVASPTCLIPQSTAWSYF